MGVGVSLRSRWGGASAWPSLCHSTSGLGSVLLAAVERVGQITIYWFYFFDLYVLLELI